MLITLDAPHRRRPQRRESHDYTEGQPVRQEIRFRTGARHTSNEGYMGLQNHSDNDIVFFKEVALQPLR